MAHEIETKVLDIDKNKIIEKLISLGADKKQETRLFVDWYQTKGEKEGSANWFLRIRSNSQGKHEVTWKGDPQTIGIAKVRREINFLVEEPEKVADLFKELGLEKYGHQEKDRATFTFKDWQFDIDQYPGMPPYLEIEGKSEEHLKEGMKLLGLESNRTYNKGERTLIQEVFGLDWYNMKF
ncbi:MAG: CYTH domain-containing protein [bacterium]|nr:CYTH domain-containing protein [bacterium]